MERRFRLTSSVSNSNVLSSTSSAIVRPRACVPFPVAVPCPPFFFGGTKLHFPFRWIRYKQAEEEMAGKMTNLAEITFFASQKQVEKELAESLKNKHALVLRVPPRWMNGPTRSLMTSVYVENFTKLISVEREDEDEADEEEELIFSFDPLPRLLEENDGMPWHMIQRKRGKKKLGATIPSTKLRNC